jgi:hypothetical protein
MVPLASRVVRGHLNPLIVTLTAASTYSIARTRVVAGMPRAGTTWLAEIVHGLPRSALLFEPLYPAAVPAARAAGLGWHTCLLPGQHRPSQERFIDAVLRGKVLNAWTTSFMATGRAFAPRSWVVKLVRANMLLGWMTERFPHLPAPAFILRHPCATIASQCRQGWSMPTRAPNVVPLRARFPRIGEILNSLSRPMEYAAAWWCVETCAAMHLTRPHRLHVISYEGLVTEGAHELARLERSWGVAFPPASRERLGTLSQMTKRDSVARDPATGLRSWRKALGRDEIDAILGVVRAFGLDFYTEAPEPDYDRLYKGRPVGESRVLAGRHARGRSDPSWRTAPPGRSGRGREGY